MTSYICPFCSVSGFIYVSLYIIVKPWAIMLFAIVRIYDAGIQFNPFLFEQSSFVNENSRPAHMEAANRTAVSNEIETLLIIHEKKGGLPTGPIPGQRNESSSSDSEEETPKYSAPSHNTGKLRYTYMQVHTEMLISCRHIRFMNTISRKKTE